MLQSVCEAGPAVHGNIASASAGNYLNKFRHFVAHRTSF